MSLRLQRSLVLIRDRDLRYSITPVGFLIQTDPNDPTANWCNPAIVGDQNYPNTPNIVSNVAIGQLITIMNNIAFPFSYDMGIAFTSQDLWSAGTGGIDARGNAVGYAIMGGICTGTRFAIVEHAGFISIGIALHEFLHNNGVPHDGESSATGCSTGLNFVMVPQLGATYNNLLNVYRLSNCSISIMKRFLLQNGTGPGLLPPASCLMNQPNFVPPFNRSMVGQFFDGNSQCRYTFGNFSEADACGNDATACQILYCVAQDWASCKLLPGYGYLDGTRCDVGKVCFQGNCVAARTTMATNFPNSPCTIPTNPCLNGGSCWQQTDNAEFYMCYCTPGFTGQNCQTPIV